MQSPVNTNNPVSTNSVQSPSGSAFTLGNPVAPAATTPQTGKKYKIMIVEDETDAREVFVDLLNTAADFEVLAAVDGLDALAKVEAEQGKVDLILLDIVMPRLDGVETLKRLREDKVKYGDPIVIMLTNLGGEVAIETAMKLGSQGYLMKIETEPLQLLEKVREYLSGKFSLQAFPGADMAKPQFTAPTNGKEPIPFPGTVKPATPEPQQDDQQKAA